MEDGKIYEVDVCYNKKLLDWLEQFHVQVSVDEKSITIKVPFSSPKDLAYAKNLLEDALVDIYIDEHKPEIAKKLK